MNETLTTTLEQSPQSRVIRSLRSQIEQGQWSDGAALPSSAALSEMLGVDRKTVLRAVQVLIDRGVLASTGKRVRTTPSVDQSRGLLSKTVVVISAYGQASGSKLQQPGWGHKIQAGVSESVSRIGRNIMILHERDQDEAIGRLAVEKPFGVVVAETTGDSASIIKRLEVMRAASIPAVVYGGAPEFAGYDRIASCHETGAYELTRWLIGQGRRQILCLWESHAANRYWVADRRAGYERAMLEAGLKPLPAVLMPEFPEVDGDRKPFEPAVRTIAGYLVEPFTQPDPVDGIMTLSDRSVYGVAAACRVFGKVPHRDVSLVGYDDYYKDCNEQTLEPAGPQATMDKQNAEIGRQLVSLLVDRIEGRIVDGPVCRTVKPQLILAESQLV